MAAPTPRLRAALLALAGLTACVAVPDPDLTVRAGADAAIAAMDAAAFAPDAGSSPDDAAPLGGRPGEPADLGGGAPGPDLDLISEHPRDAGADGEPRLAEQTEFGPAARVVTLEMPANAPEAEALGCRVVGRERGSALYGAFHFSGRALTSYVTPDAGGIIELVVLARMPDWQAGVPASALGSIGLTLEEGARGADVEHFSVRSGSTGADFEPFDVAADGTFVTAPEYVSVMLPLLYGGQTIFTMQNATLRGRLRVDGPGFALKQARLEGYYTRDGVAESIRYMDAICSGSAPEDWCGEFRFIVPQGACTPFGDPGECDPFIEALSLVVGGFDAHLEPGMQPQACDAGTNDACNAVGVCLALEMAPVVVTGRVP